MNTNWIRRLFATAKMAYNTFLMKISDGIVTYQGVHALLSKHTTQVYISDKAFITAKKETMEKLIKYSPLKYRKYQAETYDCDDFSFSFMGLMRTVIPNFAVGIVWTNTHAFNFFIDSQLRVWAIEPQNNKVFPFSEVRGTVRVMMI